MQHAQNLQNAIAQAKAEKQPLCKYGVKCYRKNVEHFKSFRHPSLEKKNKAAKSDIAISLVFDANNVPTEILISIFTFLPTESLATTALASKRFQTIVDNNDIWRQQYQNKFSKYISYPDEGLNYKKAYFTRLLCEEMHSSSINAVEFEESESDVDLFGSKFNAIKVRGDDGDELSKRLEGFLKSPKASECWVLSIGNWSEGSDGDNTEIVQQLVSSSNKLSSLKAIYVGDIDQSENEMSWIQQSDLTGIFDAFPQLLYFKSRGSAGLEINKFSHANLLYLTIETGGMPSNVIQGICESDLPNLIHLELWLGTDDYGADYSVDDLRPLLYSEGENVKFPKLQNLGLVNCYNSDDIVEILVPSPIVKRISVLDLSLGTLSDRGGNLLLQLATLTNLKKLDLHHHFISEDVMAKLQNMNSWTEVNLADCEGDSEDRYVSVGE